MRKLSTVMKKLEIESVILNGMSQLVGEEKALEAWDKLERWTFTINYRATGRLGQCAHRARNIDVANILLKPEHAKKLRNTVIHEIAHAVNPMLFGRCDGHGYQWSRIMRAFGEAPQRCSTDKAVSKDIEARRKAKAKQIWGCTRCDEEYPILKRRKHPITSYKCGRCRSTLYIKRCAGGRTYPNPNHQAA